MSQTFTDDCFAGGHVAQTDMQNIENNFAALKSCFSGSSAPSNAVAGMWWFDTSSNILKIRNEANSAWQSVWDFANNKPVITNLSNEITGAMISSTIKDAASGTASLRTLGTGSAQACAGNDSRLLGNASFSAGDVPIIYSDGTKSVGPSVAAYTWHDSGKEIRLARGGTLRIKFQAWLDTGDPGYARVYRNTTAVGTQWQTTAASSNTVRSQDIAGWSAGDYVRVYIYHNNTAYVSNVKNLRLYCAQTYIDAIDLSDA